MKNLIILFFLFLFTSIVTAQTQKQWLNYADKSFEEKDYYGASLYYRKAMLIDSSNLFVVYKYAESLKLYNEYKLAEHYYKYVYNKDRGNRFPENLFWLGTMQKYNAKYIDARKSFIQFVNTYKKKDSYYYKKAAQEVKSCEYAQELIKNPIEAKIYNLGDSLNSVNAEFGAVQINDSTLLFSSLQIDSIQVLKKDKKHYTQLFEAGKADTLWKTKQALDSIINKAGFHNANGSFDSKGNNFYFSQCNDTMLCEIYVSELKENQWQEPKRLNDNINLSGYTSTQANVSLIDTTEILFFVSNRPGGQGKLDIWYSIKENGNFTNPINLGSEINSIDDELSPWYNRKTKTLYFSSSWHYGLGGQDVFKSSTDSSGFAKPVNIGYPINSSVNDMYYTHDSLSRSGFLTSNRKGSFQRKGETCCNDIWHFESTAKPPIDTTPVVQISPLEELFTVLPIKLYFHNDEPNPKTLDTTTSLNYLTTYNGYSALINTYKENYSQGLLDSNKHAAADSIQSFFENQVNAGVNKLEEFTEMLYKQLEKGYKLDLTVKGHASPLAKTDYNVHLTLRRISSLENYLREYKGGIFNPYLSDSIAPNGGHLKITRIPFGEFKAEEYISDNLNDQKSSVYSISAALHRNIEIVSVALEHRDSLVARIKFRKEIHNFGSVVSGTKHSHIFKFHNYGKSPLVIADVIADCPCIEIKVSSYEIAPGEKGEIEVLFDTTGLKGKQLKRISINSNAIPAFKELSITAEVK